MNSSEIRNKELQKEQFIERFKDARKPKLDWHSHDGNGMLFAMQYNF